MLSATWSPGLTYITGAQGSEWWNTLKAAQERERGVDEPGFFGIAVNRLISSMTNGLVDESGMSRVRENLKDLHEALQSVEAPNP